MKRVLVCLLFPVVPFFLATVWLRNKLYDRRILKVRRLPVPVVSVGNLTFGGTGKTPVVAFLVELLCRSDRHPVVLSRGYRGNFQGVRMVPRTSEHESEAVRVYGDEPVLLAGKLPNTAVLVGRDRYDAGRMAIDSIGQADSLIMDDAFQHRKVHRDLDLVLLDASRPLSDYRMFPLGRAREGWGALRRADAVLLTKVNLAPPERVTELIERIRRENGRLPIFKFIFELHHLVSLYDGGKRKNVSAFSGRRAVLMSGLGNPRAFEELVRERTGAKTVQHFVFPDHHAFSIADIDHVIAYCLEHKVDHIILSEKDAVKVRGLSNSHVEMFWVAELAVKPQEEMEFQFLQRMLRNLF